MKTIVFRTGLRSHGKARCEGETREAARSDDREAARGVPDDDRDAARERRSRLDALFRRANILALIGAAAVAAFFAASVTDSSPQTESAPSTDPLAAVAVAAEVHDPASPSVTEATVTDPAELSASDPSATEPPDPSVSETSTAPAASETTPDSAGDAGSSVWSYVEGVLRRILRRESD